MSILTLSTVDRAAILCNQGRVDRDTLLDLIDQIELATTDALSQDDYETFLSVRRIVQATDKTTFEPEYRRVLTVLLRQARNPL